MINRKRFEMRRQVRSSHSILASLGFFILSSGIVFGGSSALLTLPAVSANTKPGQVVTATAAGEGAKQSQMVKGKIGSAPAPSVVPVTPAPTPPAPSPTPAWQLVSNESTQYADVAAHAGMVINDRTGEVLAAKNADQKLPMASITKLMTAWVALDRASMDKEITVSNKAANTPPTHMPLGEGEVLTLRELMYAMLLTSANDAAQAIADGLGGEDDFINGMNAKAQELGLTNTQFANPTGFDAPGHGSSAADLARLAHQLFIVHPELISMIQQPEVSLPATATHKAYYVANFHQLVRSYQGFLAGKPGFTGDAGNCLLTLAERDGKRVIAVVLNTPNPAGESTQLLDYGLSRF